MRYYTTIFSSVKCQLLNISGLPSCRVWYNKTDYMKQELLRLQGVSARVSAREILKQIDLTIGPGETVVLLGANGAGKSTLGAVIAGLPRYTQTSGQIWWQGEEITMKTADERSLAGIFLTWQNPPSLPGVNLSNFLRQITQKHTGQQENVFAFRKKMTNFCEQLGLPEQILTREVGVGFSGGEKKKLELLQLLAIRPQLAILDELDSGLDADAVKVCGQVLREQQRATNMSALVISHTTEILEKLPVDRVIIMDHGQIVHQGDTSLIARVRTEGYGWLKEP